MNSQLTNIFIVHARYKVYFFENPGRAFWPGPRKKNAPGPDPGLKIAGLLKPGLEISGPASNARLRKPALKNCRAVSHII